MASGRSSNSLKAKYMSLSINIYLILSSAIENRRIVTRSKTGSLTPKQFADSITTTTGSLKSLVKSSSSDDTLLVISKDGDITRVTRNKAATISSSEMIVKSSVFKLGEECRIL